MSVIPVGFGASSAAAAFSISNSLRFNSGSSQYLSRTFGAPTTQDTFTFSAWVKRSKLATLQNILGVSTNTSIGFPAADTLVVTCAGSATITTSALYRDPTAWFHVVYKQTTGAATLYVNGASVGTSSTVSAVFNTAVAHQIGAANTSNYTDGYLSDVYFIDGQALTPSSFGETNADGVWVPRAYTGSYGTNGFHLDFADGTSTTTLGYDAAGSNDWTLTGMTRAAGVNECWMTDTPTNNFATLNPISVTPTGASLSEANLKQTQTYYGHPSSFSFSSGKWYWEVTCLSNTTVDNFRIGIAPVGSLTATSTPGDLASSYAYRADANKGSGGSYSAYGATYTDNDIIGVAADMDAGTLVFYKNGVSQGTAYSSISGLYCSLSGSGGAATATLAYNFGQRSFTYTPPTGYKALCTSNRAYAAPTTSGSFTGNSAADGPYVWINGNPETLTINSNAVTWGTHADKTAGGFKLRTSASTHNASSSNTFSVTVSGKPFGDSTHAPNTAKGNP